MRALEVLRSLRPGSDPSHAASRFLQGLDAMQAKSTETSLWVGAFRFCDVCALTQRLARHRPAAQPEVFREAEFATGDMAVVVMP
ncbi:unnamed protein product [Effrenium voratum]|uniref:Uncharacterized protein n=1 Tax=Effrenium voratum TaxID=2562239 RepID=A0AA36J8A5_9DINO|nr:unnamed protein product [Effrenium voratum]